MAILGSCMVLAVSVLAQQVKSKALFDSSVVEVRDQKHFGFPTSSWQQHGARCTVIMDVNELNSKSVSTPEVC